jgi:hypothetical protein
MNSHKNATSISNAQFDYNSLKCATLLPNKREAKLNEKKNSHR